MRAVMSGGLVYEFTQEDNDYGLVQVNDNATVSLLNDYDALKGQLAKLDLEAISTANSTATALTPPACSPGLITDKRFSSNFDVPDVPRGGQDLIDNGIDDPKTGKLVDVKETAMPVAAYDSSGMEMTGLKLNVLADDAANTPSGSGSGGAAGSSSSSSSAMAAPTGMPAHSAGVAAAGLLGLLLL